MTGRTLSLFALLIAVLMLPLGAYAQGNATGAISGVVVNNQGTSVSNAQVEVTPAGSGAAVRTVFSDASGNFTVASLPVGPYDVAVTAAGFSTSKYSNVTVRFTETTRLNPSLAGLRSPETGVSGGTAQSEEKVIVVSTPPVVAVETSSPATGRTV